MRLIALCILNCLLAVGCATVPHTEQYDCTGGFSSIPEALNFIVDCVEQNDVKKLTAACVGRGGGEAYLAKHPGVFSILNAFHESKGLMKSYGKKTFPENALFYKLGGHGKMFPHLHIDFVKQGDRWHLADIWNCR